MIETVYDINTFNASVKKVEKVRNVVKEFLADTSNKEKLIKAQDAIDIFINLNEDLSQLDLILLDEMAEAISPYI